MNETENPFHSPNLASPPPQNRTIHWRTFWLLNIGLVVALAAFLLFCFAQYKYDQLQLDQQLCQRRYATYDHEVEYHSYPIAGLIALLSIFAVPNLIFFATQLIRRKQASEN